MKVTEITIDPQYNIAYIMINDNKVTKSVRQENGVVIDYDYKGDLVGIELLNASKNAIIRIAKKFRLNDIEHKADHLSKLLHAA